jgi:hypothetical protein
MFGHTFECCKCGNKVEAGFTPQFKLDSVPNAVFNNVEGKSNLWMQYEAEPYWETYCKECSVKLIPFLADRTLEYEWIGNICF